MVPFRATLPTLTLPRCAPPMREAGQLPTTDTRPDFQAKITGAKNQANPSKISCSHRAHPASNAPRGPNQDSAAGNWLSTLPEWQWLSAQKELAARWRACQKHGYLQIPIFFVSPTASLPCFASLIAHLRIKPMAPTRGQSRTTPLDHVVATAGLAAFTTKLYSSASFPQKTPKKSRKQYLM